MTAETTPTRRVAAACLVGSAIEFYDFLIYGTATVGNAAPLILVALRLLQGFAAGGEWATRRC